MRGEIVETEIVHYDSQEKCDVVIICPLCAIGEAKTEDRIHDWYEKYREDK